MYYILPPQDWVQRMQSAYVEFSNTQVGGLKMPVIRVKTLINSAHTNSWSFSDDSLLVRFPFHRQMWKNELVASHIFYISEVRKGVFDTPNPSTSLLSFCWVVHSPKLQDKRKRLSVRKVEDQGVLIVKRDTETITCLSLKYKTIF